MPFSGIQGIGENFNGIQGIDSFVFLVIIMICKPDSGIFGEAIIEAFEEVNFAKDIGVIGNHDSSFAERSATTSNWVFLFTKVF